MVFILSFYSSILRPILFSLDAELTHNMAIHALKLGLSQHLSKSINPALKIKVWGLDFPTPIGIAAGFDKNADVFEALLNLGFGFVETGTVTPLAQRGNDKPRVFRLPEDKSIINRLGFNNRGLDPYTQKLKKWAELNAPGIIGANIGKNKLSKDHISDFVKCVSNLSNFASYLVINVSSPNTPGLRDLQTRNDLKALLIAVTEARNTSSNSPPLLVKIAPDLFGKDKQDIADVALETNIDGIIISNTTIGRPAGLKSSNKIEKGGLSGEQLFESSTQLLRDMYKLTEGKLALVGVGGVSNGAQAYAKIKAGASLVQLYTAMIYKGPGIALTVSEELATLLRDDGYSNISDAVGADHR
jgi:dihydroorotate dehydrogenase